jgi:TetR/AcrR family transcriptional regulator, fatty acid metabolism regulator protein
LPDTVRDLRRGQIVAAARRLVAEQGLEALTIGALEGRLSFTRGVITYHFANKDEIVQAVFASAIEEIDAAVRRAVEGGSTVEAKVRAVLHGNVRGFVDSEVAGRVLLSFWGRLSDAKVRALNAELYAKYRRRAAKLLRSARTDGLIAQVDPGVMGALLVGIVLGIATQHYFEPGSIDVDGAIDEATRTVMARLQAR